jgi:PAS domain S-box-containing protein
MATGDRNDGRAIALPITRAAFQREEVNMPLTSRQARLVALPSVRPEPYGAETMDAIRSARLPTLPMRSSGLTDLMPLPLWATRPDGTVQFVNRAWVEYSGLTAQATHSPDNPTVVHPEDLEAVRARWQAALKTGSPFEMQYRVRRGVDGAYRWHLVRGVAERSQRGGIDGWLVVATDIDDQKRARQAAENATRMKDELLANVSHELRRPLNAVLGWTQMLRSGMVEESRAARALETIERNAHLQAALIEDLLDASRIVTGKLRLQTRTVDVVALTRTAFESMLPTAEAKGVELALVCGPPQEISGDPDRLHQIVGNLIANAVKFTPEGGRVEVRVERADPNVEITVADTGLGMSPELLPHVFDRFRQAAGTTHGLGLGLAIVRHLVDLHGGHVRADSPGLGLGSSFKVSLPAGLLRSEVTEPGWFDDDGEESRPRLAATQLKGVRVLFVDDQAEARELFTELLERCGATVIAVDSADATMSVLATATPDVLVSDIGLPDEDGYALIRRVRALGRGAGRVPAIAVSGFTGMGHRRRALKEGFQMCLAKPINPAELVGLVASLAEGGPAGVTR